MVVYLLVSMESAVTMILVSALLHGYTGVICDVPIISECDTNPCENGGNCSMVAMSQVCNCPEGFKGQKCEISSKLICNFPFFATFNTRFI